MTNIDANLIGKSPFIRKLRKDLPQLAKLDRLLITGERGTGKSLVAKLAQEISKSKLVVLNASASSDEQIKETLGKSHAGLTVLIKEIEEFSFLNQGIIAQHLGSAPKKGAGRLVVTSRENITDLHERGLLLDSLYQALRKFDRTEAPTLRERPEDVPLLVEHFIRNACESVGTKVKVIDINALDFLVRREWKENILELKSMIEKSVFTSEDETIGLPDYLADEHAQLDGIVSNINDKVVFAFDKSLSNLEKTLIEKTLEAVGYHQSRAAEILNITPQNLRYRLRKFKIKC
jgi:DNA-binding NtrC family response regulator